MKKTMTTMKLVWLTMMALPLMAVADLMRPAWDETVPVPIFHLPEWLLWGFVFVIALALMFFAMRRKRRLIMEFVVFGTMIVSTLTVLLILCQHYGILLYEKHVIHHPESRPDRHYDIIMSSSPHTEDSPGDARW